MGLPWSWVFCGHGPSVVPGLLWPQVCNLRNGQATSPPPRKTLRGALSRWSLRDPKSWPQVCNLRNEQAPSTRIEVPWAAGGGRGLGELVVGGCLGFRGPGWPNGPPSPRLAPGGFYERGNHSRRSIPHRGRRFATCGSPRGRRFATCGMGRLQACPHDGQRAAGCKPGPHRATPHRRASARQPSPSFRAHPESVPSAPEACLIDCHISLFQADCPLISISPSSSS